MLDCSGFCDKGGHDGTAIDAPGARVESRATRVGAVTIHRSLLTRATLICTLEAPLRAAKRAASEL